MQIINQEYQNISESSSYPFADNMALGAGGQVFLPPDYLVDAMLTLTNLQGAPYLYSITGNAVEIRDTETDQVLARGEFDGDICRLTDNSGFSRPAGVLVAGPGRTAAPVPDTLVFASDQTLFASAAYVSLDIAGVTGIVADNHLFTDDVVLAAGPGIRLEIDTAENAVVIDAVGRQSLEEIEAGASECFDLPPPVRALRVVVEEGSYITAAVIDNVLRLFPLFDQEHVCPLPLAEALARENQEFDPGLCPEDIPTADGQQFIVLPESGVIRIETGASPSGSRPIKVSSTPPGPVPGLGQQLQQATTRREAELAIRRDLAGSAAGGGLTFELRGPS